MTDEIFDDTALERNIKEYFGVSATVESVIVRRVSVGPEGQATLFLTDKKQLLLYIDTRSKTVFSDIKKIVSRMGLRAELYFPPKNQPDYFERIGRELFSKVFPGRAHISDEDIIFYRTLAPYSPALVQIGEVKDGHVYMFDSDSRPNWRVATKFAYRRIKTS